MVAYGLKSQSSVMARPTASEAQQASSNPQDDDDAQLQRLGKKPVLKVRILAVKALSSLSFLFFLFLLFLIITSRRQGITGDKTEEETLVR